MHTYDIWETEEAILHNKYNKYDIHVYIKIACYKSPNQQTKPMQSVVFFNSLWLINLIWRHRTGSTLTQIIAWCLLAPSNYLNQCWLLIEEALWYPHESNLTASAQVTMMYKFDNVSFKNDTTSSNNISKNTDAVLPWCRLRRCPGIRYGWG